MLLYTLLYVLLCYMIALVQLRVLYLQFPEDPYDLKVAVAWLFFFAPLTVPFGYMTIGIIKCTDFLYYKVQKLNNKMK